MGMGSIPGQGTKIPEVTWHGKKIILTEKNRRKKHGFQCPNAPAKEEKREVERPWHLDPSVPAPPRPRPQLTSSLLPLIWLGSAF